MSARQKYSVPINVPYLMELVEESGMNRRDFSEKKLMRGSQFVSQVITQGKVSPLAIKNIVKLTGCDEKRLSEAVPYNPEDYRLRGKKVEPQEPEKDGTIADYIALISDSLIELAKNQSQVSELLALTSKQIMDNARYNAESNKLFEAVFEKLNDISKKVDEIHRELK